jgi:hypothetical protein
MEIVEFNGFEKFKSENIIQYDNALVYVLLDHQNHVYIKVLLNTLYGEIVQKPILKLKDIGHNIHNLSYVKMEYHKLVILADINPALWCMVIDFDINTYNGWKPINFE